MRRNTITDNGAAGIVLTDGAKANVVGATISRNKGDGISVLRRSQLEAAANAIEANDGNGITVMESSRVKLVAGPARFTDIAKPFDTALNAVTKHLKLLERAGLISREKQGREVFISFRPEPLRLVSGWVHEYERFWSERLDQFEEFFREKRKRKKIG